jgi:glycine/D-amino acid oxidase-like deaminating enzyme
MGPPLSADYREAPLWTEQVTGAPVPEATLAGRADVVIVGGGYCGLAAAAEAARRGLDTVVCERAELGWGASTRNGGMVIPELKAGPAALARKYGPLGPRMHAAVNEAFDFVEKLIADEGIECDYERSGQLYLAHHRRVATHLEAEARELQETGEPVRFLAEEDLGDEIGSDWFHGGLLFDRTGGLHPARFHHGLVELATRAGAALHERTAVRSVERRADGFRVVTDRGTVEARHLIVATNAYADGLFPDLQRSVLPVGSFIVATEPLPADVAEAVNPRRRMLVDSKNFLFYWRLAPDRRMVFGGRRSLSSVTVAEARDHLYRSMVRIHPQLEGTRVARAWGGQVAITFDRMPHVGQIDGAWYATGCNGSGVALNTWLGHRLAATVDGEPPPPFAELRTPRIPLWRLRRAYLPAVGLWFRVRDEVGA